MIIKHYDTFTGVTIEVEIGEMPPIDVVTISQQENSQPLGIDNDNIEPI